MAEEKKSNRKIKAKDNIDYSGEVTVKVAHGTRVVKTLTHHNAGALPLFEFITLCLAGDYYQNKLPRYLRVFDSLEHEITLRPVVANSSPSYINTSTESSVTLSFVVPYSLLTQYTDIKTLKIYSTENYADSNKSNYSASITLNSAISISSTSNLVVAWKMVVRNATA